MRFLVAVLVLACFVAVPAHAQQVSKPGSIQLTAAANVCTGSGFGLQTLVQLVLNGTNAGTPQPCGQAVTFSSVLTVAGTYTAAIRAGNSAGFSAPTQLLSSASTPNPFQFGEMVIPPAPPGTLFTITCGTPPGPCQAPIVITPVP